MSRVYKPKSWELLQRLTAEECQELKQFAEQNGKNWKSKLIATWRSSSPQCVRVRNIVGEEWLSIIHPTKIPSSTSYSFNPTLIFNKICDLTKDLTDDELAQVHRLLGVQPIGHLQNSLTLVDNGFNR